MLTIVDIRPDTPDAYLLAARRAVIGRTDSAEARLVLAHLLPVGLWLYQGGHHIAIHERTPNRGNPDAGKALFRIIE